MKIYFYDKTEKIDNVEYPIGNMLMAFVDEFGYNGKTIEQKDRNLMMYIYKTYFEIAKEDLGEIFNKPYSSKSKKGKVTIQVNLDEKHLKEFTLSNVEFRELVMLVECIKTFISLEGQENGLIYFMYYFNTYWRYTIPKYIVKNNEAEYNSNKELLEKQKKATSEEAFWNEFQESMKNYLEKLKYLGKNRPSSFITEYECNDIIDILLASVHYICNNNIKIRICRLCDRLFIPKSNSQKYCNNIRPRLENESDEDYDNVKETCSQYNRNHQSIKDMEKVDKAKRSVRQRIQKRIRENKEEKSYLKEWEKRVKEHEEYYEGAVDRDRKYSLWILNESDKNQKRKRSGK